MASILYKWFLVAVLSLYDLHTGEEMHPFYVSIVEIEHNVNAKTLELSCKIFTDDFEKTLRAIHKNMRIDLVNPVDKAATDKIISDYIQKNLQLKVNGQPIRLKYLGYENIEEGIYSYFESMQVDDISTLTVTDKILYDYKNEQTGLIHVTVKGKRKSTRLINPENTATFHF